MELSEYVTALRREVASVTRFASDDVRQAAEMLTESLDSSLRLVLLEVLSAASAEITAKLDDVAIDVRLAGGEPDFVVTVADRVPEPAGEAFAESGEDAGAARITLRLSETLKSRIESAAAAEGLSVNSWLVHAASSALAGPSGPGGARRVRRSGIGQRYTGYARS